MRPLKRLAAGIAAVLISDQAALAEPVPVRRDHAYSGPQRPAAQLATVYGKMLTQSGLRMTFICGVDGKSHRATIGFGSISVCPSVVYLLPGSHQLVVDHGAGSAGGIADISVQVAAGRVYEIEVGPAVNMRALVYLKAKPPGYALTFKDIMPDAWVWSSRQNARIDPAAAQYPPSQSKSGEKPASSDPKAPRQAKAKGRPDAREFSFTIWPPQSMSGSFSADTEHGRLTCHSSGFRSCRWD